MRRAGFTLIELMIVVAIVGVLAAVAIPAFLNYQLRSKATESLTNLQAIGKAEEAYYAEYGIYVSASTPVPATVPGTRKAPWSAGGTNFRVLGWEPEGAVYYQYVISADDAGSGAGLRRYTAEAASDLDGDGEHSYFGYVKPAYGQATGLPGVLPGTTCEATGVFNPSSGAKNAQATAGPCDNASGRGRF
jgi:type IV pilus assembly protein PilA